MMGTTLTKEAYTDLINGNIKELNKYMPEHNLEKRHTIEVLKWSIDAFYDEPAETFKRGKQAGRDEVIEEIKKFINERYGLVIPILGFTDFLIQLKEQT